MLNVYKNYTDGYFVSGEMFHCAYCNKTFEDGNIYELNGQLVTAHKAMHLHLQQHQPIMDLLNLNKHQTGLSEIQTEVLKYTAVGLNDNEIAKKMNLSASTIRNHKFKLREKAKQAQVFLSIMDLLNEEIPFEPIHKEATMVDDRYAITAEEKEKVLKTFIDENGRCTKFPSKEKRKIIILNYVVEKFEFDKNYTEKEVNTILKEIFEDHVTVRRYLIEYGYLNRSKDCITYWRNER